MADYVGLLLLILAFIVINILCYRQPVCLFTSKKPSLYFEKTFNTSKHTLFQGLWYQKMAGIFLIFAMPSFFVTMAILREEKGFHLDDYTEPGNITGALPRDDFKELRDFRCKYDDVSFNNKRIDKKLFGHSKIEGLLFRKKI